MGGTGRKWAHAAAWTDGWPRTLLGALRDPGVHPVYAHAFPCLDAATLRSIRGALGRFWQDVLEADGAPVPSATRARGHVAQRFDRVHVAIDAPSGFAVPGVGRRDTESTCGNFTTPSEAAFHASARGWLETDNVTPLRQRVYWKGVGFELFADALRGAGVRSPRAADVAANAAGGIGLQLARLEPRPGWRTFEAFPTQIYRCTHEGPARDVLVEHAARGAAFAARSPVPGRTTHDRIEAELTRIAAGELDSWTKTKDALGDVRDAYACMLLGLWADTTGVRGLGRDPTLWPREGVIVLPG
ncbi:MAG: hypothetical protein QNJ90_03525 [Planctomycetota bacterium]|nr:hypothetical protein [Planctomycetota bacterium]